MKVQKYGWRGFTLIELAAVMAVGVLFAAVMLSHVAMSAAQSRRAVCANNLRNLHAAYVMYLADHGGQFFPWMERQPDGSRLYYWGKETGGGAEGERPIDMSQARLAPYLGRGGGVEICPAMPYHAPYFKRKYNMASYGYGINVYLLADSPQSKAAGIGTISGLTHPAETIAWGDAAQINTFQAPASPANPMLEEWYALDVVDPQKYHFRHAGRVNVIMADGRVRSMTPHRLDPRCDGRVGALEPGTQDYYLRTRK